MKPYYLISALILLASACTFQPQGNNLDAEFHPPFVYQNWQSEHYTLNDHAKACAISSGYNGITVFLMHKPGEDEMVSVKSNRRMEPGDTLTVNAGGNRFEAYDTYFPSESARALADHLAGGGKAYLEWSQVAGTPSAERIHMQNIVQLDGFAAQLKECRDSFK